MTDQDHADRIKNHVSELNKFMAEAVRAGLIVEIDVTCLSRQDIGEPKTTITTLNVVVARPL